MSGKQLLGGRIRLLIGHTASGAGSISKEKLLHTIPKISKPIHPLVFRFLFYICRRVRFEGGSELVRVEEG
jgi:hypothetical protein